MVEQQYHVIEIYQVHLPFDGIAKENERYFGNESHGNIYFQFRAKTTILFDFSIEKFLCIG